MSAYIPAKMAFIVGMVEVLEGIARDLEKDMHRRREAWRPRVPRGGTLRPSDDTPMWNALAAAVKPRLRRRGARALLARELGVHRARIGEFFNRRASMPDAERTLRLLVWLSRPPPGKLDATF